VSFIVCVVLYAVFRLIVVLFYVMCVICLLCLIVLPLPPSKNPFAIKINNKNNMHYVRMLLIELYINWVYIQYKFQSNTNFIVT
jgi:hypothetical protein